MKQMPLNKSNLYINFRELVEDIALRYGEKTAYSFRLSPRAEEIQQISYAQLAEDVRCLSTTLISKGVHKGNTALIGKLSYGWVCSYLALLSSGAVVVPLDPDWSEEDLAQTATVAECKSLFCAEELLDTKAKAIGVAARVQNLMSLDLSDSPISISSWIETGRELRLAGDVSYEEARISPDALALLVFTSGTTGKGKGVMLSQTAILTNIYAGLQLISVGDRSISVLPPHHTFGSTINLLGNLLVGSNVYITSGIKYLMKEMQEHQPTHLILVPLFLESFYRKIMDTLKKSKKEKFLGRMIGVSNTARKAGIDLRKQLFSVVRKAFGGKLTTIICGGAPINQNVVNFFQSLGITVINGYGITECSPLIAANRNDGTQNGRCGYPISTATVKIKNPDENGEGEIIVKGACVMMGYYKDPVATAAAFDNDGYFLTGDYGKFDENGCLYITGRLKNLIILSNGKNVYPEEIEGDLASRIPGLLDVVVYEGISRRGQEHNAVVAELFYDAAFLQKEGVEDVHSYTKDYINDYNKTAVPYKKIGIFKIRTEEFPKNTLRKIMRFQLDKTID